MTPEQLTAFLERNNILNKKQEEIAAEQQQLAKEVIRLAKALPWSIASYNPWAITYQADIHEDWEEVITSCYLNIDTDDNGYIHLSIYDDKANLRIVSHGSKITPTTLAQYSEYLPDLPIPDLNAIRILELKEEIRRAHIQLAELGVEE